MPMTLMWFGASTAILPISMEVCTLKDQFICLFSVRRIQMNIANTLRSMSVSSNARMRAMAIHSNANRCEFKTISRNVSRLTIKHLRQYVIWQSGKFNSLMSIPITAKLFFQSARSSLNHLSRIYRICAICLMSIECSK